jgi:hypothetical protein
MVVEHAQRMTAPLAEREVALEIHLPELVGARALNARMGRGGGGGLRGDETMPVEDAGGGCR